MLHPDDRSQLLEALKPPEGFELDYAIGTTFSLDLLALLRVPLAFTQFEWEDAEQGEALHPTVLLKTLRDYAGHMTLFCQAGHIHVPPAHRPLFTFLEDMVVEVNPPDGVFHPKVWALRYENIDEKLVKYRLLVSSRNLTFDRCWDTLLMLEGNLTQRTLAIKNNHPLGDFFKALPAMALRQPVNDEVLQRISQFEYELRRTQFESPDRVKEVEFWPLGIGRGMPAFDEYERMLVVSPFVSEEMLHELCKRRASGTQLISRIESLAALPADALKSFKKVWVLNELAQPEPTDISEEAHQTSELITKPTNLLQGLHAKLYIGELGAKVDVFTGSANATTSGFYRNVEFMVKLEGHIKTWGINSFLGNGDDDELAFGHLLQEYKPAELVFDESLEMEQRLNRARRLLLQAGFDAQVSEMSEENVYSIALSWQAIDEWPKDMAAYCWLISLSDQVAKSLNLHTSDVLHFGHLADASLTAFFAFELKATDADQSIRFVVRVPLRNAPKDRRERVLFNMLNDPEAFTRFLALLLGDESAALAALTLTHGEGKGDTTTQNWLGGGTLLEAMLRALNKHPWQLDEVNQIVTDLRKVPGGERAFPQGFDQIWEPIWEARNRLKT